MSNTSCLTSTAPERRVFRCVQAILVAAAISLTVSHGAYAADASVPWECSNYSGEAQVRCMQTFIEAQRDEIGKLEADLQSQRSQIGALQDQLDRHSRATADLQRQLDQPPRVAPAPSPYVYAYPYPYPPYSYAYPPGIGLGLYFGTPGFYGSPYFYLGPRYYRHHHHW